VVAAVAVEATIGVVDVLVSATAGDQILILMRRERAGQKPPMSVGHVENLATGPRSAGPRQRNGPDPCHRGRRS
jgi:hypothetical protein